MTTYLLFEFRRVMEANYLRRRRLSPPFFPISLGGKKQMANHSVLGQQYRFVTYLKTDIPYIIGFYFLFCKNLFRNVGESRSCLFRPPARERKRQIARVMPTNQVYGIEVMSCQQRRREREKDLRSVEGRFSLS